MKREEDKSVGEKGKRRAKGTDIVTQSASWPSAPQH